MPPYRAPLSWWRQIERPDPSKYERRTLVLVLGLSAVLTDLRVNGLLEWAKCDVEWMMNGTLSDIRVLLLQVRERVDVERQERACFIERCGIEPEQLDALNLAVDPVVPQSRVDEADVVMVGGAGIYSATKDYAFTQPLLDTLLSIVQAGKPYFGACWGHQMLVRALGGSVITDESKGEVGTHEVELTDAGQADPLYADLPRRFSAHMGHMDYAVSLPAGAVELARSSVCPNQAMRLPGKPIYGTQFHSELSAKRLAERLAIYQEIYIPEHDEFERIQQTPKATPDADGILRRFLEMYVVD